MTSTGKGPLNYTTSIDATKSATECVARLAQHGASGISISYDTGHPTGLSFVIGTPWGPRQYSLPVNVAGTRNALQKAYAGGRISRRYAEQDQAERVAWRVLKDWLEAQLALIEAGVAELPEVMLPYLKGDDGLTVWQRYLEREQTAITAGGGED